MEPKAASSDKQIANKGNEKDKVVSILHAVAYALGSQVQEQKIGKGVDHLGHIGSDDIVLVIVSM